MCASIKGELWFSGVDPRDAGAQSDRGTLRAVRGHEAGNFQGRRLHLRLSYREH